MTPILATAVCLLFILYLFWKDGKRKEGFSKALWIPFAWMFFAGSRYFSSWLDLGLMNRVTAESTRDGSPVDALVFFSLIMAGIFVLLRRRYDWVSFLTKNKWICLYLLYCGISVLWADYVFVSFKRYIKELGNVIMVLVVLSETQSYQAIMVILRRLSFLLLPLSVLFIKYYPDLGRAYHQGSPMFTGVADQKNGLGLICLMIGIYYAWDYFLNLKRDENVRRKNGIWEIILIGMAAWLLYMSDSATSLGCLAIAVALLFMSHKRFIARKPDRIWNSLILFTLLFLVLETTVGLTDSVIRMLGRDPTLTTRVPMWHMLINEMTVDPIWGAGYMSFWSFIRIEILWSKIGTTLTNAHNGYLEQYLNLGYIGLALTIIIIVTGLLKIRKHLYLDYPSAVIRFTFIIASIIYNYTESSFHGINNMWILTLLSIVDVPVQQVPQREESRRSRELRAQRQAAGQVSTA
jgi:O-antigen ligase